MFWEKFLELCAANNKKPTAVVVELNISRGNVTHWKAGKVPQYATLLKLADYFGVSVDYLLGKEDAPIESRELSELDGKNVHMIPLYENVSAGFGALAVSDIVDYIPLYFATPAEAAQTLCIKVKGDSMAPRIENGDIVQVRKQDTVDSGSIAVVLLDGADGLVKVVTYGDTWIELRSVNRMYKPIRLNGADTARVQVVGLVTKIIKSVTGKEETVYPETESENKKALLKLIDSFDEDQLKQLEGFVDFLAAKKKK